MSSPKSSPGLSEIAQIAIVVGDVSKATDFYRDVLGLTYLFGAGPGMAFLQAGSVRLMLTTPQGVGEVGKNSILYFRTSNIESEFAAIISRGARSKSGPRMVAKMPDHELWLAAVRDPDGNIIELMSEVRRDTREAR